MIQFESNTLKNALACDVNVVSMHRPSKKTLEANYDLSPLVNSYGATFFKEFKYVSDSRRRWREDVEEIIASGQYNKLHILTHAFWYNETEKNLHDSVKDFVCTGNKRYYKYMDSNFTDLNSVLKIEEV